MIKNHLKIVLRDFSKQWKYSLIKIGGLALSIAACLLILLYVLHERSFDTFYPEQERIYRIVGASVDGEGKTIKGTSFPAPFGKAIQESFPEIQEMGRLLPNSLFGAGSNQITTENGPELYYEEGFTFADQAILDLFPLPMVYGNLAHALDNPMTVVISRQKAEKLYPGINPIGKQLFINGNKELAITITGVMEDIPNNSHLYGFDYFVSLKDMRFYEGEQENWAASNYITYVKLGPGADITKLQQEMFHYTMEHFYTPALKALGRPISENLLKGNLILQPLRDIHLKSNDILDYKVFTGKRGDNRTVQLFIGVALFILGIACVNFVNLSTARSAGRTKEVAIRKIVGSPRKKIVFQFLIESIFYCFLSVVLGFILAWLLLPLFGNMAGKSIEFPWQAWWLAQLLLLSSVIVGIVAGMYPAFYLSSFRPTAVLKGKSSKGSRNPMLQNSLVVFQFSISIILIICTYLIYQQLHFIMNREMGFDKEQILVIEGTNTLGDRILPFKEELKKSTAVENVTIGDYLPVHIESAKRNGNPIWVDGRKNIDQPAQSQFWQVDEDYLNTMGIELISGRNFIPKMATDSQSVIINERLANMLQLPDPVGQRISNEWASFYVIGVVKDFDFESLQEDANGGMVLALGQSPHMVSIKLKSGDLKNSILEVEKIWQNFAPNQTFRFTFLDEQFASIYNNVTQTAYILTSFAGLAIFIACLGLFGLAAYLTERRAKEIGIRKVLGSSVSGIVTLLSKDFIKLVLLAIVIAVPLAWWAMSSWLEDFSERIDIQWWVFGISGLLGLGIAFLTISWQAITAARANPVNSLRDE